MLRLGHSEQKLPLGRCEPSASKKCLVIRKLRCLANGSPDPSRDRQNGQLQEQLLRGFTSTGSSKTHLPIRRYRRSKGRSAEALDCLDRRGLEQWANDFAPEPHADDMERYRTTEALHSRFKAASPT